MRALRGIARIFMNLKRELKPLADKLNLKRNRQVCNERPIHLGNTNRHGTPDG
jgi:hypothetical protein